MQQTIVLLYAEVTVAIHSFDLKGVIHYRRDFTYSSFQTGERGTCQARGNCSRSGSHGIHIKAALSHRTKGRAYRCNAGACVFAFLIIQIETTRGDMEKEKEDRRLFLSDI